MAASTSPAMLLLILVLFTVESKAQLPTSFLFNEFNQSDLILLQGASIMSNIVRLTNQSQRVMGRALYRTPLRLKTNNSVSSFSTTFVFSMVPPNNNPGHGLTFLITPSRSAVTSSDIGYLGLLNASADGSAANHLFAVEFDTHLNHWNNDIDGNHVGVDLNTINSSRQESAGFKIGDHFEELNLASKQNIQAWIDYDGRQHNLSVTIAIAGAMKPLQPLISMKDIDLASIFKEEMYLGFSAATGRDAVEDHYILAWSFSTDGMAPSLSLSHLPSFLGKNSKKQFAGIIAGVSVGILILITVAGLVVWLKKYMQREVPEEWEVDYWPHRIPYEELRRATQGFADGQFLGRGGFGKVYRGVLRGNGLEVAIKCFAGELNQGMKDFIAEISILGRLQHRNLVQIRGWCRNENRLFIVYDYMPNGSLDRFIFGNPETVLGWSQRYAILKGVAASLLYLHQEWDREVVHRDLKSQNILLDSYFNAKLGDFGLARLHEHTQDPQTSGVAGTLGYVAPEVTRTGKATASSDVFSFGIVLLEVACGRKPVDLSAVEEQQILVEWVRQLHMEERLGYAVDPKLGGKYNLEEMERVLKLGVLCSHPEPESRPDMRQVSQILEGEARLPPVHISAGDEVVESCGAAMCSVNTTSCGPPTAR